MQNSRSCGFQKCHGSIPLHAKLGVPSHQKSDYTARGQFEDVPHVSSKNPTRRPMGLLLIIGVTPISPFRGIIIRVISPVISSY